jgi:ketosteroid isomerase-like protein
MKSAKTIFPALILPFIFVWNAQAQKANATLSRISEVITNSNRIYSQGFEKHQAELVVQRYSEDGAIMAPNMPAIAGRQGFEAFFNGGYEQGIRKINFKTLRLFGLSVDFVNEEGLFELRDINGDIIDKGKYLVVWKKTRSGWKMYRDIFNTDVPR